MSEIKKRFNRSTENKINDTTKVKDDELNRVNIVQPRSAYKNLPLKVLSRIVVIFSLLTIVYFSTKQEKIKPLAKQSDLLPGVGQVIECSSSYMKEINKYYGCFPQQCKRYVTDNVITVQEADRLLEIAKKGLKLGGSSGGASILDLHSGALSKDQYFINMYKNEEYKNVFTENDFNIFGVVKDKIKQAVGHHFGVNPDKIYLTHPTFFSEITSKPAKTLHDEYWHPHVDKETYKSFHYTSLLYLGDYNIDFNGGRFVFIDEKHNRTVEPRKARLSMFTSGAENLHYVEKVTSGVRYAVTISFTCDKEYAIDTPSLMKYQN